MQGTPAAEVFVDEVLVAALLAEQHPDLAGLPIEICSSGWDNAMFRLGPDLAVRMPRRSMAAPLIENEQQWLPQLPPLPIAIPKPVRTGVAGCGYPWPWSIVPWAAGEAADRAPPSSDQAVHLAGFLKALHLLAPTEGRLPVNPHRGGPLADKVDGLSPRFERLISVTDVITSRILGIWNDALAAPQSRNAVWLHGDLHARNVVIQGGKIEAVIDWGDICTGDPATDLLSIWGLFDDPSARQSALQAYGASPDLIARSKGWAVLMAAILLDTGLQDEPRHAKMGHDMFRRLDADG